MQIVKLLSMQRFLLQLLAMSTMYSAPKYSSQAPTSKYYLLFCSLFIKCCHLWITPCGVVSNNKVISEKEIGNGMEGSALGTVWCISRRRHKKASVIRTTVWYLNPPPLECETLTLSLLKQLLQFWIKFVSDCEKWQAVNCSVDIKKEQRQQYSRRY
jgi:hypothetical protein